MAIGFGLFCFAFTICGAIVMGGDFADFFNVPSIFICGLITIGFTTLRYGRKIFTTTAYKDAKTCAQILRTVGWSSIHAGWIGALIASIQIGANMKDWSSLGEALSVTLVAVFYGYSTWIVCEILAKRVSDKIRAEPNSENRILDAA